MKCDVLITPAAIELMVQLPNGKKRAFMDDTSDRGGSFFLTDRSVFGHVARSTDRTAFYEAIIVELRTI